MKKKDELVFRIWSVCVVVLTTAIFIIFTALRNGEESAKYYLIFLFFLMVVFFGSFYIVLHQWITGPIKKMTNMAFRFAENDFHQQVDLENANEFTQLSLAMNKLGKSLQVTRMANHEKQEILGHILETLPTGVCFINKDMQIAFSNRAGSSFIRFWKRASNEMEATLPGDLNQRIQYMIASMEAQSFLYRYNSMVYDVHLIPLFHEDEQTVRGILCISQDITEQENLEKMRKDFISNVSHDLRTPLSMIKGYSEAIMDDIAATVEEKNEMASIINDEVSEMTRLVNSLIDLSQVESGQMRFQPEVTDAQEFLAHLENRFRPFFKQENIEWISQLDPQVTQLYIDQDSMHQALFNLIDNASRYVSASGKKEKWVKVTIRSVTNTDEVEITVRDNAMGINEADLAFIFERFYKSDKSRELDKRAGSGIGLSIVKSVVEQHMGQIMVHTKEGIGSEFVIRIPNMANFYSQS